jgi:prepilin-type N-terminal cleavage/methylation domain-containing protein
MSDSAPHKPNRTSGFSLIELVIALSIIMIVAAISLVNGPTILANSRVDTAYKTVLEQMRQARQAAVDERRVYRITFQAPGTIITELVPRANGCAYNPAVPKRTSTLPTDIQFRAEAGIPTAPGQTPDGFGTGANAIDFDIDFGGAVTQIYFQPDGSAQDNLCRVNNGLVYMARPGQWRTSRAVSMLGTTGRIKGWRLIVNANGSKQWQ